MSKIQRLRDLTLVDLYDGRLLVIACDSAGAVGPKPHDMVSVPGEVVGRFTARVALMELLAVGAEPIVVVDTLSVEPIPTGAAIRRGIASELVEAGLDPDQLLNGSEEKNIPTVQTGVGVTAIGLIGASELTAHRTQPGDLLCVVGWPHVGSDVLTHEPEVMELTTLRHLRATPGVHELVPVGSRGTRAEAEDAWSHQWSLLWLDDLPVPLDRSAGPATCLLATIDPAVLSQLSTLAKPVTVVAAISLKGD